MQNQQISKSTVTRVVRENAALGVGSHDKYSTRLCLVLYLPLDPTPHAVFSRTTLVLVL